VELTKLTKLHCFKLDRTEIKYRRDNYFIFGQNILFVITVDTSKSLY